MYLLTTAPSEYSYRISIQRECRFNVYSAQTTDLERLKRLLKNTDTDIRLLMLFNPITAHNNKPNENQLPLYTRHL